MISEIISHTKAERTAFISEVYEESFPAVAGFVKRMGGTFEDAKDIFHDALVIFYEKLTDEDLAIVTSPKAYVLGIAKHLWVRKFKDDFAKVEFSGHEELVSVPADFFPEPKQIRLLNLLEMTGKRCLELLKAFYFDRLSMKDVAKLFQYSTVRSATVQKFKCIERIRSKVKENSWEYEDIAE